MVKFSEAMQLSLMFSSFVKQFFEIMMEIKWNLTNIQIFYKELPRQLKQVFSIVLIFYKLWANLLREISANVCKYLIKYFFVESNFLIFMQRY